MLLYLILNDLPDQNLRNIIDKLAEFVARNGLEFEQMTKTKQQSNPKFAFLYGGEYFSYYQWRKEKERERFGCKRFFKKM